jgi:hypothetical protein
MGVYILWPSVFTLDEVDVAQKTVHPLPAFPSHLLRGIGLPENALGDTHLDVFRLEVGAAQRFENSAAGFRAFSKWLGKAPVARIVFEPTGPYHKAFEVALAKAFPLIKVNPLQARRFSEAHRREARQGRPRRRHA